MLYAKKSLERGWLYAWIIWKLYQVTLICSNVKGYQTLKKKYPTLSYRRYWFSSHIRPTEIKFCYSRK
jgi:hypothetical protein